MLQISPNVSQISFSTIHRLVPLPHPIYRWKPFSPPLFRILQLSILKSKDVLVDIATRLKFFQRSVLCTVNLSQASL